MGKKAVKTAKKIGRPRKDPADKKPRPSTAIVPPKGWVSTQDFADILGVTIQRVHKAAKTGKVSFKVIKTRRFFHKEKALAEWKSNIGPGLNPSGKKKEPGRTPESVAKVPTFEGLTTQDAERREKVYKARLSELKYQEQAKKLVSTEEVQSRAFELARKTRDAVMSVPARTAHELAAETDPHRVELYLMKELQKALERLIEENRP